MKGGKRWRVRTIDLSQGRDLVFYVDRPQRNATVGVERLAAGHMEKLVSNWPNLMGNLGKVVGEIPDDRIAESWYCLHDLHVGAEDVGQGIDAALMNALTGWADEYGHNLYHVTSAETRPKEGETGEDVRRRVQAFYEQWGFYQLFDNAVIRLHE